MKAPDQTTIDARYAAKVAARATGQAPVFVSVPTMPDANPLDAAVVDTRYRLKMAAHLKTAKPQVVAAAPSPSVEPAKEAKPPKPSGERATSIADDRAAAEALEKEALECGGCTKENGRVVKPCVEHFVKAGYKAEDYEEFFAAKPAPEPAKDPKPEGGAKKSEGGGKNQK